MFYVYVDWTADESAYAFYVGKGKSGRVKLTSRNKYHRNIKNKHGMHREILMGTLDESFALDEEIRLIALHNTYHWDNDKGANFTRGGEGSSGAVPSPESRQARSEKLKGIPKAPFSEEHLQHLRDARVARQMPPMKEETKQKLKEKNTNQFVSDETRKNQSEAGVLAWANKEKTLCQICEKPYVLRCKTSAPWHKICAQRAGIVPRYKK